MVMAELVVSTAPVSVIGLWLRKAAGRNQVAMRFRTCIGEIARLL